jgi:serine/threonine protein kinase
MMDVLDAVAVAHAAGVIHRDLKPTNILVDGAGRARVMDFGIAARIRDHSQTDPAVPHAGTVGYLSPEAANGASPAASMDIFSAGVVLAELLLGRPLIEERDPHRAVYRVAHEQRPPTASPGIDDRLRAIVAPKPDQRFSSAQAFSRAGAMSARGHRGPVRGGVSAVP